MSETKIIAFEGIDGTGKSVQMERLKERLTRRGLSVGTLSFPDYGSFFGGCVGRFLMKKDGVSASDVDQRSMALWFAMDRWAAFQGFDFVTELEFEQLKIPRPHLQLILDMDLSDAQQNVSKKGYRDYAGDEKDEYEKQDAIQIRARAKYLAFGERLKNVQVIPCMEKGTLLPIDTIAQRVYDAVEKIL